MSRLSPAICGEKCWKSVGQKGGRNDVVLDRLRGEVCATRVTQRKMS